MNRHGMRLYIGQEESDGNAASKQFDSGYARSESSADQATYYRYSIDEFT